MCNFLKIILTEIQSFVNINNRDNRVAKYLCTCEKIFSDSGYFVSCYPTTLFFCFTHFVMIDKRDQNDDSEQTEWDGSNDLLIVQCKLICFHVAIYRAFCRGCFRRFTFIFVSFVSSILPLSSLLRFLILPR